MRYLAILVAVMAGLVFAAPAMAKKYKDVDGGIIEVTGSIQATDEKGKPIGPKKNVEPGSVTIAGQPATPVDDPLVAARVARTAATLCTTGTATVWKNSALGARIWQAWHYVNWCWNYPNITYVRRWTDGKGSNGWSYDGVVSSTPAAFFQWCCGSPYSGHRRQFRYGFHFPVWVAQQTAYPTIKTEAHGNGTFIYFVTT